MKTLNSLLFATVIGLLVSACGGSDDAPKGTETTHTYRHVYQIPIQGIAGSAISTPDTLYLRDIMGVKDAPNFIKADLQSYNSFLKIEGLEKAPAGTKIENLKIKIGNSAYITIGTITMQPTGSERTGEVEFTENADISIVKAVLDEMGNNKEKAVISITFTPTETITLDKTPIYLDISINASFRYMVYE